MLKAFVVASALALAAVAENIQFCGQAPYYASMYTCYGANTANPLLCSIFNGEPLLACGPACYLPEAYTCSNASGTPTLAQRNTPRTGKFMLQVINSGLVFSDRPSLNGQTVNARAGYFYVGGAASTSCPPPPSAQQSIGVDCSKASNTTVFRDNTLTLDTLVPGGQKTFLYPSGALGYTGAGPAGGLPSGVTYPIRTTVVQDGYASPPSGYTSWYTCPVGTSDYQIYAYPASQYCVKVNLKVIDVASSVVGAYLFNNY